MILVLADDTSGAAEMAATAATRGFSVDLRRDQAPPGPSVDVVIYDTQTRSVPVDEAVRRLHHWWPVLRSSSYRLCYKKVDSVLRGHVAVESWEMARALHFQDVLLCPANPSRNRLVTAGCLTIDGIALHDTPFRFDPEFPRTTSHVNELLWLDYSWANSEFENIPIVTPDVESLKDLERLASTKPPRSLAAGANDFFAALLDTQHAATKNSAVPWRGQCADPLQKTLLVCGSKQAWTDRLDYCQQVGIPSFTFCHGRRDSTGSNDRCRKDVLRAFAHSRLVALGIHPSSESTDGSTRAAQELADAFGQFVSEVVPAVPATRLLVEGGSTASSVLYHLGWNRLGVLGVCGQQAVMMPETAPNMEVVIKPGSYPWPADLIDSSGFGSVVGHSDSEVP